MWHTEAIVHLVPVPGHDLIGESVRQVEHAVGIGMEGTEPNIFVGMLALCRRIADKHLEASKAYCESARLLQKVTTVLHEERNGEEKTD
jgi:hypothetical protein